MLIGLAAISASCGEDEVEEGTIMGTWLLTSSVDSTRATFREDGTYELVQTLNGQAFSPVTGTYSVEPGQLLVQETGEGMGARRNSDTFFVDADSLVIGGVFLRTSGGGGGLAGDWTSHRGVEQARGDGGFYRSSVVTKVMTLDANGGGQLQTTTERDNPVSFEAEPPTSDTTSVFWSPAGAAYSFSGGLSGEHHAKQNSLVNLVNAYKRQ